MIKHNKPSKLIKEKIISKGANNLNFDWDYTQLKFKPGTVKKKESSTIGLQYK